MMARTIRTTLVGAELLDDLVLLCQALEIKNMIGVEVFDVVPRLDDKKVMD